MKALFPADGSWAPYHIGDEPLCGADGEFAEYEIESTDEPCPECLEAADGKFAYFKSDIKHIIDGDMTNCGHPIGEASILPDVGGELCKSCTGITAKHTRDGHRSLKPFYAAKLTANGQGSLIATIPCGIWTDAGIDHDDPGFVNIAYNRENKRMLIDFDPDELGPRITHSGKMFISEKPEGGLPPLNP